MPDRKLDSDAANDDAPRDALLRRIDALERENARLRKRTDWLLGPDNPDFDIVAFQSAMRRYVLIVLLPLLMVGPIAAALPAIGAAKVPTVRVGPLPLIDVAGKQSGMPGMGLGVIAFGGFALGGIAFGGGAVGIIAVGGGSAGVLAFGGGAIGIVAFGGGAVGVIAIGGSAYGWYALGQNGGGKFAFTARRQDRRAVEFFTRYLPKLGDALRTPVPVIPVDATSE